MDFEILLSNLLKNTKNDVQKIDDIYEYAKKDFDIHKMGIITGIRSTFENMSKQMNVIAQLEGMTEEQKDILQKLSSWFSSQSFIFKQVIEKILSSKDNSN